MTKFLHEMSACADSASIDDWTTFAKLPAADRASRKQALRDPLLPSSGKFDHVFAICGFSTDSERSYVIYYWHETLHEHRLQTVDGSADIENFLKFFLSMSAFAPRTPSFEEILGSITENEPARYIMDRYGNEIDLVWYVHEGKYFTAVVGNSKRASPVIANRARSLAPLESRSPISLLACHFEYFLHRSPLNLIAPLQYLSRLIDKNFHLALAILVAPRYFTPWISGGDIPFAWPWQRCLASDDKTREVVHIRIPTCSLVFDLRRSFLAMELLRDDRVSSYSEFIQAVVKAAKVVIGAWGGYFDKETGDGIVAHFVDDATLGSSGITQGVETRAFCAAREIIESVGQICEEFRSNLIFEIEDLGASVGIHSGTAVWIYSGDRVMAVGDSVVIATRLCSEAPPRSIFISASVFNSLTDFLPKEERERFERRPYRGKEFDRRSELFGYCHT